MAEGGVEEMAKVSEEKLEALSLTVDSKNIKETDVRESNAMESPKEEATQKRRRKKPTETDVNTLERSITKVLGRSTELEENASLVILNENTDPVDGPIIWFDILPEGQLIFLHVWEDLDAASSRLALYSASTTLLSKLELPVALSADTLGDGRFIVPIQSERHLQIVKLDNGILRLGNIIRTRMKPFLIQKFSKNRVLIAAFLFGKLERLCFQILDLRGYIKSHIFTGKAIEMPQYMKMNKDRNIIYIVDFDNGCYGFNLQGDMVFQFTHKNCNNYTGIAVDKQNFIYFTAEIGTDDCLIKISPSGDLMKKTDIMDTCVLKCDRNIGKLYFVTNRYNDIIVKTNTMATFDNMASVVQKGSLCHCKQCRPRSAATSDVAAELGLQCLQL